MDALLSSLFPLPIFPSAFLPSLPSPHSLSSHLLSFLLFILVPLPIFAEQQRITVKPEVTAIINIPPPVPKNIFRSKMWLSVGRHLWSAQWQIGKDEGVNISIKHFDRVGRVQWVRAGLALGYSHPNITGFPRSTSFTWNSLNFNQKIFRISITNLLYCTFTWAGQVHNGWWSFCRRVQSSSGSG